MKTIASGLIVFAAGPLAFGTVAPSAEPALLRSNLCSRKSKDGEKVAALLNGIRPANAD